jgi:lipopolysaccharide/colanic/teichoic acid biosynthesis glycosyltransferase
LYKTFLKPFFDRFCAVISILLFLPLVLPVLLLLLVTNEGRPFFFQLRPGKNGKLFRIVKFRTMNEKKDSRGNLLPDTDRLTAVGKFIRKTSLDEVPQLINVIRGDMSLVGPRPLLPEYLNLYNAHQKRRHEVKPGITGWAQVNGRNAITWEEKFELDVWYVEHQSFWLDIKILFKTLFSFFKSEEINYPGNATMPNFKGDKL